MFSIFRKTKKVPKKAPKAPEKTASKSKENPADFLAEQLKEKELTKALASYSLEENDILANNIYVQTALSICHHDVDYPTMYRYMMFAEECGIPNISFMLNRLPIRAKNQKVLIRHMAKRLVVVEKSRQKLYEKMAVQSVLSRETIEDAVVALGCTVKQFYDRRWHLLEEGELKELIHTNQKNEKENLQRVMDATGMTKERVKAQMKRYRELLGIDKESYYDYRAWEWEEENLQQYFTNGMSNCMRAFYNKKKGNNILRNKRRFAEYYGRFLKRDSWESASEDYKAFKAFLDGKDKVIVKPMSLMRGAGIYILSLEEHRDIASLYEELVSGPEVLVEEVIKQHPKMSEVYAGSVNTVRLVTLNTGEDVKILNAFVRFGVSGAVDNVTAGGLLCRLDMTTGIITTDAVNRDGNLFKEHPVSHVTFKGFQIPLWEQLLKTAKEAIKEHDFVKYVGWDFAVCEDGIAIIEGNSWPMIDIGPVRGEGFAGSRYLFEGLTPFGENPPR